MTATVEPTTRYPKYEAFWPPYHSFPFAPGEPQTPRVIRDGEARFDAWAPAPGNATPSWSYVSTPAINAGKFSVSPGGWFDPGDHPNVEIYYILQGTLHLSNPDTSDVDQALPRRRRADPGVCLPPRLQLRGRGRRHPLVGPG